MDPHINYLVNKISKLMYKVANFAKPTWGWSPFIHKNIYLCVIEKNILYACNIWFNNKVKFKNKLISLNRSALLAINKAYRTVSNDALCVLAGCYPIDILVEMENDFMFKMSCSNSSNSCYNLNNRLNVNYIIQWYLDYGVKFDHGFNFRNEFYADGSRINDKVGCAFVYYSNGIEEDSRIYRLSEYDTVFNSELLDLCYIISDCKSVLESICIVCEDRELIVNLRNKILKLNIKLLWTRAHIGTVGNEKANQYAKDACSKNNIDYRFAKSKSSIRKELNNIYTNVWQDRWNNSTKGRWTWDLVPNVSLKRILSNFYLNQVLTKNGVFPDFQAKRFGKSDLFLCGDSTGALEHIIFECVLCENIRSKYLYDVNINVPLVVLLAADRTTEGIRLKMDHYVKSVLA